MEVWWLRLIVGGADGKLLGTAELSSWAGLVER